MQYIVRPEAGAKETPARPRVIIGTMSEQSKKSVISAIASVGKNRELGLGGELLWRIRDDLQRVKALTMGHPLIMGRKTHESIGRVLPGRTNIVITRQDEYAAPGCIVVASLEEALDAARSAPGAEEIFIFGGAEVYAQALPRIHRLYLTVIDAGDPEADAFFPPYEEEFTKVVETQRRDQDGLAFVWLTLERP